MSEHDETATGTQEPAASVSPDDRLADRPIDLPVDRPRPSPTSRARRAAAAGVETSRPAPRPRSAGAEGATGGSGATGPAAAATVPTAATRTANPAKSSSAQPAVAAGERDDATVADQAERPGPSRTGLTLLLSGAAVTLVVLNIVLFLLPVHRTSSTVGRDQVLSASKADTALVISYNYQHIDADATKAVATLTGAFATDYQKSVDTVVKVQAPKVKAVVEGQVDSAGVEAVSGDGRQVTVIVFGQQKVTNSTLSQPRTDLVRLRVTMTLVGKVWKISQLAQI